MLRSSIPLPTFCLAMKMLAKTLGILCVWSVIFVMWGFLGDLQGSDVGIGEHVQLYPVKHLLQSPRTAEEFDYAQDHNMSLSDVYQSIESIHNDSTSSLILERASARHNCIAFAPVSRQTLEIARNWVKWSEKSFLNNWLFVTNDDHVFHELTRNDSHFPILLQNSSDEALEFIRNQQLMEQVAQLLHTTLSELSLNVVLFDVQSIWLQNPIRFIQTKSDITDFFADINGLGIKFLKSSEPTSQFTKNLQECQTGNVQKLDMFKRFLAGMNTSSLTFEHCWKSTLERSSTELFYHQPAKDHFPSGTDFFVNQLPQKAGVWPVAIDTSDLVSLNDQILRLKLWNLWLPDEPEINNSLQPKVSPDKSVPLLIHVITYSRYESLKRLLKSLLKADYMHNKVSLRISVDVAVPKTDADTKRSREQIISYLKTFKWHHGNFEIVQRTSSLGLLGQWLASQDQTVISQPVLVLEDDLEVSPLFYSWLKTALQKYYYSPMNDKVFGISLSHQHMILGKGKRTPRGNPLQILDRWGYDKPVYFQQALQTWGTIVFPFHWKQFLSWYSQNNSLNPCMQNIISSRWFQRNKQAVWSVWFHRFAFERGYLSISPNLGIDNALVINHREAGLNFRSFKGPSDSLAVKIDNYFYQLPNFQDSLLLDFHFLPIRSLGTLEYRSRFFPSPQQISGNVSWSSPDIEYLSNRCFCL